MWLNGRGGSKPSEGTMKDEVFFYNPNEVICPNCGAVIKEDMFGFRSCLNCNTLIIIGEITSNTVKKLI